MHEPTLLRGMLKHWEEAITSFLSYFVAVELQLYITAAQLLPQQQCVIYIESMVSRLSGWNHHSLDCQHARKAESSQCLSSFQELT